MVIYGIIVLLAGIGVLVISVLLCLGHIELLHDYHRNNVNEKDFKIFGLKTGLSLMLGSLGMISSGLIAIITRNESLSLLIMLLLFIPLFISIVLLVIVIVRYNKKFID